jgi:hypothetical protein
MKPVIEREELTEEVLRLAEEISDGFYPDGEPIDWYGFIDRMETRGYDFGGSMESPAITGLKKHIRKFRKTQ